ncbi:ammonium transporter, Amt family [Amycolatopsis arida]|uniref:Ammonium transporter n=1 Tax=Amycolatopsis arida TaxID=587909 RepID=A0A1I5KGX6_9PSEU|nr:ammonium transporter [Amycolatopsis arida]TDX97041.1 Amt family ammonium transporter [Amycolatopsis arida]SFO84282.1 ammonium transporter, Amt family [Amycolatopsis arida]
MEGNTAWLLTSAALVLLMTPGLAFFYGGMVRSKSVLNMLMMCFGAIGLIGVLWVVYGYSTAFGSDIGGLFGNPLDALGLSGLMGGDALEGTGFVAFQGMFAIITVALIAGAVADRMKFSAWLLFGGLWATVVYFPVAHWVWAEGGWIFEMGAQDFAGGTAVHINAGAAALGLVLVLGKRSGWPKEPMKPHNLPFVMLGAGLLWFGWFGFNAGSALAADNIAGLAFINTLTATCAAMLGWLLLERIRDGHATSLGAASGVVAGLVAITPACAFVDTWGALAIGAVAGIVCALAVGLKYRLGYDDSLDVVGVHLVGGLIGTLLIGFLGTSAVNDAGADGLLYGGGLGQLGKQAVGAFAVLAYSLVVAVILGLLIKVTLGLRVQNEDEVTGIDEAEHAETAYEFGGARGRGVATGAGVAGAAKKLEGSKA